MSEGEEDEVTSETRPGRRRGRDKRTTRETPASHRELTTSVHSLRADIDDRAKTSDVVELTKVFREELMILRKELTRIRHALVVVSGISTVVVVALAFGIWSISGDSITRGEVIQLLELSRR